MTTPHYLDSAYVQALIAENAALKATVARLAACWPGGDTYEALKQGHKRWKEAIHTRDTWKSGKEWLQACDNAPLYQNELLRRVDAYIDAVEAAREGGE